MQVMIKSPQISFVLHKTNRQPSLNFPSDPSVSFSAKFCLIEDLKCCNNDVHRLNHASVVMPILNTKD